MKTTDYIYGHQPKTDQFSEGLFQVRRKENSITIRLTNSRMNKSAYVQMGKDEALSLAKEILGVTDLDKIVYKPNLKEFLFESKMNHEV